MYSERFKNKQTNSFRFRARGYKRRKLLISKGLKGIPVTKEVRELEGDIILNPIKSNFILGKPYQQ